METVKEIMTEEILARLPVKTLGRCRCVCKSWRSLITQPFFIKKQASFTDASPCGHVFVEREQPRHGETPSYSLWYWDDSRQPSKRLNFPIPQVTLRLVGSYHGFLCIQLEFCPRPCIIMWNPTIKKFKTVRESAIVKHAGECHRVVGFGFDAHTKDYKVVQILYRQNFPTSPIVEVYSLSTDSWRRKITGDDIIQHKVIHWNWMADDFVQHDFRTQPQYFPSPFVNGAVHWLAHVKNRSSWVIVSFHMVDEVFREITVPVPACTDGNAQGDCLEISGFQNSLALFVKESAAVFNWNIWLMKDYGVADSWTKQYSLSGSMGVPFEFMKNGGNVLLRTGDGRFLSYDFETHDYETILDINDRLKGTVVSKVIYKESLVLLNGGVDIRSE